MTSPLYLVTGGAGFIGSHLCDRLIAQGYAVRVLDDFSTGKRANLPRQCEVIEGDVADAALAHRAMIGVAGCFHLAAVASVARGNEEWVGTNRTNLSGTVAVLDAARAAGAAAGAGGGVPVVYASSAAVYGDLGDRVATESLAPKPRTAYGVDKLGSELHASIGWGVHRVPSVGLRFFNVYGPRQDPDSPYSGVISIFAKRVSRGLPVAIHGDGQQVRDFVYVADVAGRLGAAMRLLAREPGAYIANVCTGHPTSILQLARLLGRMNGIGVEILAAPARAGDIARSIGDPGWAGALLGHQTATPLTDGLALTLGVAEIAS